RSRRAAAVLGGRRGAGASCLPVGSAKSASPANRTIRADVTGEGCQNSDSALNRVLTPFTVWVAISPQSAFAPAADRPPSAAQLMGLNLAIQRIQPGSRLCCMSAEER